MSVSCFLENTKGLSTAIGAEASPSSLPMSLWSVKADSARVNCSRRRQKTTVAAVNYLPSALVGWNFAFERREGRDVACLGEQVEEALALARALFGLVGRGERVPVGLVITPVREIQEQQDLGARACLGQNRPIRQTRLNRDGRGARKTTQCLSTRARASAPREVRPRTEPRPTARRARPFKGSVRGPDPRPLAMRSTRVRQPKHQYLKPPRAWCASCQSVRWHRFSLSLQVVFRVVRRKTFAGGSHGSLSSTRYDRRKPQGTQSQCAVRRGQYLCT